MSEEYFIEHGDRHFKELPDHIDVKVVGYLGHYRETGEELPVYQYVPQFREDSGYIAGDQEAYRFWEEVDPCPFCKGKWSIRMRRRHGKHYIGCNRCRARGPLADTEQRAIAKWNKASEGRG